MLTGAMQNYKVVMGMAENYLMWVVRKLSRRRCYLGRRI